MCVLLFCAYSLPGPNGICGFIFTVFSGDQNEDLQNLADCCFMLLLVMPQTIFISDNKDGFELKNKHTIQNKLKLPQGGLKEAFSRFW